MADTTTTHTVSLDTDDMVAALRAYLIKNRRTLGLPKCEPEQITITLASDHGHATAVVQV